MDSLWKYVKFNNTISHNMYKRVNEGFSEENAFGSDIKEQKKEHQRIESGVCIWEEAQKKMGFLWKSCTYIIIVYVFVVEFCAVAFAMRS